MIQWLRSLVFTLCAYGAILPVGVLWAPWAILDRKGAVAAAHAWTRFVLWIAPWMAGIRIEVRGTPPTGEVMIAAKHQSFLDIIMIYASVPQGKFIMKRELIRAPILGQYALRMGCVPVDRGKRGQAVRKMVADVRSGREDPGQLIIYPQGTRVPPGESRPYKTGTGALYQELGQPCVPVACNVGLFWPKKGIMKRPGTAIIEFLDPIPAGLSIPAFMERLEHEVESASNRLMDEARRAAR
ncbi:MAG: 1-acyl-sn-glycerol-3-phosphate acyltransferase [Rubellimicrobium sp.]|nr:1-acyl-sn-glycerol-3-phosphate acyltransferase [Rubellimicrobium sp.]